MGVKGLIPYLKKKDLVQKKQFSDFAGQTWAIDASIFMYKFAYNSKNKKPNSHIDGFYQLFRRLLKSGIYPVIVLDGKPPEEKNEVMVQRKKKEENGALSVTREMFDDLKLLCNIMNIPTIFLRDREADAICGHLCINGKADAVLSRDSDMLMYGADLITDFEFRYEHITHIPIKQALCKLELSHSEFVDFCMRKGTDYGKNADKDIVFRELDLVKQQLEDYLLDKENIASKIDCDNLKDLLTSRCNYRPVTIQRHIESFGWCN